MTISNMNTQIVEVTNSKEINDFIIFPLELYKNDDNFVFEPLELQKDFLSERKNPFFEHSGARFFLAKSGNKTIGRITSITNAIHNKTYNENTGFFGFFEVIDDYAIAKLLLDKVKEDQIALGFNKITGPVNFTTNDSCGILTSGFEIDPVFLMPYNKKYYADFLNRYGFKQLMDLSSYYLQYDILQPFFNRPVFKRIEEATAESKISIRQINFRDLDNDILQLRQIYNSSNTDNWGFVPLTEHEFTAMANDLKKLIPAKLILIAEKSNTVIGFIVALPDYNQVFKKIQSGKLFPFGFLKFLWYKRKISKARILILGVEKMHRNIGIDLILFKRITETLCSMGIFQAEACYVMGNNQKMNSVLRKMKADDFKKYRIYSYDLQPMS
jgi:hypothetical protein